RSVPIALIFVITVGFYFPHNLLTLLWSFLAIILAILLSLNIFYLIGASAFWTTEINWSSTINYTLIFSLGGQMVPLDLLPGILGKITLYLPYSGVIYYPAMIYLERISFHSLWIPLLWVLVFTLINVWLTRQARQRMEIQGG
ncbi:MAG: ABC-2 family transporter protein, partial [Bacilli bacterium]